MMRTTKRPVLAAAVALTATLGAAGCDDFLEARDPTVIDASTIDPAQDAATFANSGLQNLFDAFDDFIVYTAWFTGEAYVGDTFPTRNDIGKRVTDFTNGTLRDELYAPLGLAIASNEAVLELLAGTPNEGQSADVARAAYAAGMAIVLQAEGFCEVIISSGLTQEQLGTPRPSAQAMDEAITRFNRAITVGTANGTTQGRQFANAARVGLARALLFQGKNAEALAAAQQVPSDFVLLAEKLDDPNFRSRLGNTVYNFTLSREALVVPPYYRALNDPRVRFDLKMVGTAPAKSQGNNFDFYRQQKYPNWDVDIRLASGLEARYLAAEAALKAGNPALATALIAEREAAGAGSATGDDIDFVADTGTLVQLLDQKARDFWLEGTHMGDWRRNPTSTPYVIPAGTPYYAPDVGGNIGNQTCLPTPQREVDYNPNYPRGG